MPHSSHWKCGQAQVQVPSNAGVACQPPTVPHGALAGAGADADRGAVGGGSAAWGGADGGGADGGGAANDAAGGCVAGVGAGVGAGGGAGAGAGAAAGGAAGAAADDAVYGDGAAASPPLLWPAPCGEVAAGATPPARPPLMPRPPSPLPLAASVLTCWLTRVERRQTS
mmetsp:Transcript_47496/g.94861  ORF Transcript_47496/g.94861 Transcript_47496/m.94861 type:complete len:169 (+) Transcript_47496:225-731(+)